MTHAPPTGRNGLVPLRWLSVGDMIRGAFAVIRAHPLLVLGATAVLTALELTVSVLMEWVVYTEATEVLNRAANGIPITESDVNLVLNGWLVTALFGTVLGLIFWVFLSGLLTTVVARAAVGHQVTFAATMAHTGRKLPRLAGLMLVLVLAGVLWVALAFEVVLSGSGFGAFLMFLSIPFIFYALVLFSLAVPALVLEQRGVFGSLLRSRALVKGSWWRVFGIGLLTGLLAAVITVPFQLLFGGLYLDYDDVLLPLATAPNMTPIIVGAIGTLIGSLLATPLMTGVFALLYLDRRIRAENVDDELITEIGAVTAR